MKRSRSNDGVTGAIRCLLPLRPELLAACYEAPEPLQRRAPRVFNGPNPKRGCPRNGSWVSDDVLLDIRRRREWHGQTPKQIAVALDLNLSTVEVALSYRNRVHLDPGPRPAPGGAK